jgi:integrase
MTATLLTDALIDRMPPPAKEVLLRDAHCEGLCLRLQPGGSRSWILWERRDGRSHRVTLGAWPALDAAAARAAYFNRRAGETLLPLQAPTATFGDLARACIAARRLICKPSTMASFETSLNTQLLPAFEEKPVDQITPAMVARWFHSYSQASPGGANMALAAVTTVLNWAKASGKLPKATPNPAAPIRKNRRPPRGRMLSSAQVLALRRLLMAKQGESQAVDVIHLLLLTGCRFGEIAGLTWEEVLPDRLSLKDAKTGPRDVFLSKPARDILKRLRERAGQAPQVFPSRISSTGHIVSVTGIWEQLRKRAGLPDDIRLHDLRHTFASHALLAGESLPTTGRLLGHATPRTTQRYAHLDGATLEKAADTVAAEVMRLLAEPSPS